MLSTLHTASIVGLEAEPVLVECDLGMGLHAFNIVGLADKAVKESTDRVRSALQNSDLEFPQHRITINLAPADLPKQGTHFDLPIALGIAVGNGQCAQDKLEGFLIMGELGLDGSLRPVAGVLPTAILARDLKLNGVIVPRENAREAAVVSGLTVMAFEYLAELIAWARGNLAMDPYPPVEVADLLRESHIPLDFEDVRGQEQAKRALEIAAAGGHNMIMVGPPGSGKTMLAKRLPSVLPSLSVEEALEVTRIYSVAGLLSRDTGVVTERPYRSPHHSVSLPGLVGGGTIPRPGEISLAHLGVLFLDEMLEFPKHALEHLRQPLEDGEVTISRTQLSLTFPSRFILVGALNPCPCGYYGDPVKACKCRPGDIQNYWKGLSGPVWDRIDITVEVPRIPTEKLARVEPTGEPSAAIRKRVENARRMQAARFAIVDAEAAEKAAKEQAEKDAAAAASEHHSIRDHTWGAAKEGDEEASDGPLSPEEALQMMGGKSSRRRKPAAKERSERQAGLRAIMSRGGAFAAKRPLTKVYCNAQMTPKMAARFCPLDEPSMNLLIRGVEKLGLSARAFERIKRVARTIADLDESEAIKISHVAEAIQYRAGEGKFGL
ncbi:MAG: YifB family Mg chelatase-like AAA ATPase [bacterium]|jgi:magnesium chelatase family protein